MRRGCGTGSTFLFIFSLTNNLNLLTYPYSIYKLYYVPHINQSFRSDDACKRCVHILLQE